MTKSIQCINCGFLANHEGLTEVDYDIRHKTGSKIYSIGRFSFLCSQQKADFTAEFDNQGGIDSSEKMLGIVSRERKCPYFRKWHPSFSPKEHREMVDREHERIWHIFEIIAIGLFTTLSGVIGALIAKGKI
jgi:hypothetical protein